MSIVARLMTTSRNRASSDIVLVSWIASLLLPMYAVYVNLLSGTTGRCDGDVISKRGLSSYDDRDGCKVAERTVTTVTETSAFRTWRGSR